MYNFGNTFSDRKNSVLEINFQMYTFESACAR